MTWSDVGYVLWPAVYGGMILIVLRWIARRDRHTPRPGE
jgi:hypothetical protein